MLTDATEFSQTAAAKPVYDWSKAKPTAADAVGMGTDESSHYTTDFTGAHRTHANDLGALNP